MRVRDALQRSRLVGPLLFCRGWRDGHLQLAALAAYPEGREPDLLVADDEQQAPQLLHRRRGYALVRYEFSLSCAPQSGYQLGTEHYAVNTAWDGDLRLAYVSCNGQEHGDRDRDTDERNVLWQRLAGQHEARPLHLLMHGGDQIYADDMLQVHPAVQRWARHQVRYRSDRELPGELAPLLGDYLFERYLELYSQPSVSWLMARVPSLAVWDDHDICDGWGSRPAAQLDSPVGRLVFATAREQYLMFQLAAHPDALPAACADPEGRSLTWQVRLPGLRIMAPDLRSERRPERVLGPWGWGAVESMLSEAGDDHLLVLSSVPALGPRLSLVEAVLHLVPRAQKYEDDLRDQWQSRVHREEWRRFLELLLRARAGRPVTVLSGEIHLATRATLGNPDAPVHQLVASGITHPPPPAAYARALGALARLGESPLAHAPVRLLPLPGRRQIYTAQRNYLMLQRSGDAWQAWWELEHDGPTPPLTLAR